jgi:hypothetical protein
MPEERLRTEAELPRGRVSEIGSVIALLSVVSPSPHRPTMADSPRKRVAAVVAPEIRTLHYARVRVLS